MLIFPFVQTNITSQMWPNGDKGTIRLKIKEIKLFKAIISMKNCDKNSSVKTVWKELLKEDMKMMDLK